MHFVFFDFGRVLNMEKRIIPTKFILKNRSEQKREQEYKAMWSGNQYEHQLPSPNKSQYVN